MTDVHIVLVEFGPACESQSLELLHSMLARVFPDAAAHTVVVDNSRDGGYQAGIADGVHRVGGDNSRHEFSGWDCGLAWLDARMRPAPSTIVALANDTVARADKRRRVRDVPADRAMAARSGALVGWIDEYPRPVELFGLRLRQWVDTSLVLTTRQTLDRLRPLSRPLDESRLFADDCRSVFHPDAPLSANYRRYLKTYFLGEPGDAEFDHAWYAQAPARPDTFDALKIKLRCVFSEHLLSARARSHGIPLIDIRPVPLAIDAV